MANKYTDSIVIDNSYDPASANGQVAVGDSQTMANAKFQAQINSSSIKLSDIICIDNSGSDITGDGSINKPYATIAHGLSVASTSDILWVFPGTYTENFTAKAGVSIYGVSTRAIIINGNITFSGVGNYYYTNLTIQKNTGDVITVSGNANINIQLFNCFINAQSGATSGINWTNTNSASKFSWYSGVLNVTTSTSCPAIKVSGSSAAGTFFLVSPVSIVLLDNPNHVAISLNGSVGVYHDGDIVTGQINCALFSFYFGSGVKLTSTSNPVLVTNSASTTPSTLLGCVIITSSTNVVTGAGSFAYALTAFAGSGFAYANTLNSNNGAIAIPTSPIKVDASTLPTLIQGGLINYDGTNFYIDAVATRYRIPTANLSTGIIPATQLPVGTGANQLVQLNSNAQIPAVDSGTNTLVANPRTATTTSLNTALSGMNTQNISSQIEINALSQNNAILINGNNVLLADVQNTITNNPGSNFILSFQLTGQVSMQFILSDCPDLYTFAANIQAKMVTAGITTFTCLYNGNNFLFYNTTTNPIVGINSNNPLNQIMKTAAANGAVLFINPNASFLKGTAFITNINPTITMGFSGSLDIRTGATQIYSNGLESFSNTKVGLKPNKTYSIMFYSQTTTGQYTLTLIPINCIDVASNITSTLSGGILINGGIVTSDSTGNSSVEFKIDAVTATSFSANSYIQITEL